MLQTGNHHSSLKLAGAMAAQRLRAAAAARRAIQAEQEAAEAAVRAEQIALADEEQLEEQRQFYTLQSKQLAEDAVRTAAELPGAVDGAAARGLHAVSRELVDSPTRHSNLYLSDGPFLGIMQKFCTCAADGRSDRCRLGHATARCPLSIVPVLPPQPDCRAGAQ